jgi:hypothetical protein
VTSSQDQYRAQISSLQQQCAAKDDEVNGAVSSLARHEEEQRHSSQRIEQLMSELREQRSRHSELLQTQRQEQSAALRQLTQSTRTIAGAPASLMWVSRLYCHLCLQLRTRAVLFPAGWASWRLAVANANSASSSKDGGSGSGGAKDGKDSASASVSTAGGVGVVPAIVDRMMHIVLQNEEACQQSEFARHRSSWLIACLRVLNLPGLALRPSPTVSTDLARSSWESDHYRLKLRFAEQELDQCSSQLRLAQSSVTQLERLTRSGLAAIAGKHATDRIAVLSSRVALLNTQLSQAQVGARCLSSVL